MSRKVGGQLIESGLEKMDWSTRSGIRLNIKGKLKSRKQSSFEQ